MARRSSPMDGQLFAIKQLLVLREQIAPFEADFSVVEKDLDFSHMRDHLRAILAGRASLFALSSQNAVVQLMARGAPRILESQARAALPSPAAPPARCRELLLHRFQSSPGAGCRAGMANAPNCVHG